MARTIVVATGILVGLVLLASAATAQPAGSPTEPPADPPPAGSPTEPPADPPPTGSPTESPADPQSADPTMFPQLPPVYAPDDSTGPGAAAACSGTNDLLRTPDLRAGAAPTVWENYCSTGYVFHEQLAGNDVRNRALNGIASFLMSLAAMLAATTIVALQWAFSPELTAGFGPVSEQIVEALRVQVFLPYLLAVIVLAGVWGAWHGVLKRRGTTTIEGWVWAVLALTFATWFMARPATVFDTANNAITGVTTTILGAVAHIDPGTVPDDGMTSGANLGRDADDTLRRAADRIHRTLVHQPWLIGQFGSSEVGRVYGERLLSAQTLTTEELEAAGGDSGRLGELMDRKADDFDELDQAIKDAHPEAYEWFRGTRSSQRIGVAALALLAAALAGVVILLISVSVILLKLVVFLLVLLSPLFFLVGIHPGAGRVVLLRWVELLLGTVIKAVFLAAMLAVLIVSYGVIMSNAANIGWGASLMLMVLLGVAAIMYRTRFARMFTQLGLPAASGSGRQSAATAEAISAQRTRPFATVRGALSGSAAFKTVARRPLSRAGNGRTGAGAAPGNGHGPSSNGDATAGVTIRSVGPTWRRRFQSDNQENGRAGEGAHEDAAAGGLIDDGARSRRQPRPQTRGRSGDPNTAIYSPLPSDPDERRRRRAELEADADKPNSSPTDRARRQMLEQRLQQVSGRERDRLQVEEDSQHGEASEDGSAGR